MSTVGAAARLRGLARHAFRRALGPLLRVGAALRERADEFGRLIATELGDLRSAATFWAMVAADVME